MAEQTHGKKYTPWNIGDKVWLSGKNLITPLPSKKLVPKRYGPFTISIVLSPIMFTLDLLKHWKIHPTFHASKLYSYHETEFHGLNFNDPLSDLINNKEEYEVKAILLHKGTDKQQCYLVSWKGYSSASNEWLPKGNLKNAGQHIVWLDFFTPSSYQKFPTFPPISSATHPSTPLDERYHNNLTD